MTIRLSHWEKEMLKLWNIRSVVKTSAPRAVMS
jgi:hypothetical protein